MKSDRKPRPENPELSRKDKLWVALAIAIFLILFALILLFGDGLLGSLI
ncbi:MAG: hypothetical protein ACRECH_06980 [Nitrososphaerales archaeon]